jgi:hypothetical protein
MKQLIANLLGVVLLSASSMVAVYSQPAKSPATSVQQDGKASQAASRKQKTGPPVEEFSFALKDFKIDHQTETNTLNISISYRYVANIANSEYPDFRWLAKDVETLLTNYPNEDDYWEIVNKRITSMLLTKYPAIASVTCEMRVEPSPKVPYTRSSRVTRTRSGK